MQDLIHECIQDFGPPPRAFPFWDRLTYLHVPKPKWLRLNPSDSLRVLFNNLQTLFCEGVVVWGHLIQANDQLFLDGTTDCPAEFVYSLMHPHGADPEHLAQVAHVLFSLKGTTPAEPALAQIAEHLTDERTRVFGLSVPRSISPRIPCRISSTLVVRKHLPERRLCNPLLPMIVLPEGPYVALPLPERYWPEALAEWWPAEPYVPADRSNQLPSQFRDADVYEVVDAQPAQRTPSSADQYEPMLQVLAKNPLWHAKLRKVAIRTALLGIAMFVGAAGFFGAFIWYVLKAPEPPPGHWIRWLRPVIAWLLIVPLAAGVAGPIVFCMGVRQWWRVRRTERVLRTTRF